MLHILLMLACKGDSPPDSDSGDSALPADPDPATVALNGDCPLSEDWGGFVVQSSTLSQEHGVDGKVADSIWPWAELEEIASEGDCKLLRRNVPFCEGGCEAGTTCTFDGECVPEPKNQDLGTVRVRGLVQAVEMTPAIGNTYYDTSLPNPLATPGELVVLQTGDGSYGPQTLYGVAVDPLVALDSEWLIAGGRDLQVSWEPPTSIPARAQVALFVNMDVHGASPAALYCTFQDTGSGTVPGALIETLVEAGVTGFPSGRLNRRTVDSVDLDPGCMDFVVGSPVSVEVDVEGFTPCISTDDCPDGMTCDTELQVCY